MDNRIQKHKSYNNQNISQSVGDVSTTPSQEDQKEKVY